MTYAYIRVSTDKQDLENQKFEILKYANAKKLGNVEFVEETASGRKSWKNRKLGRLIEELQKRRRSDSCGALPSRQVYAGDNGAPVHSPPQGSGAPRR